MAALQVRGLAAERVERALPNANRNTLACIDISAQDKTKHKTIVA